MIYDAISIIHGLFVSDVLVILGFSGFLAFPFKVFFKKRIVSNIGGIEWQKVRGEKIFSGIEVVAKKWFERVCVYFSDVVIVDNQVLWDYIKKTYNIDSVLVEYGGDHAISSELTHQLKEKYSFLKVPYDLTISRAQEDMNIHILLDAYEKFGKRNLVVVSNWEISDYGIELKKKYLNKYRNIFIQDAIYDLSELNAIRSNALLYIHSHSLCGTAPSLVEAMSLGLPVISFDVATNRATTENDSNYFSDANSLIKILNNLDEISLKSLSKKMKEIAERRYKWSRITGLYRDQIK